MLKTLKISKNFLVATFAFLLISIVLEIYYTFFVIKFYEYYGFVLEFNLIKYIESKTMLFLFLLSGFRLNRKSSFVSSLYLLLGLFIFIPGHILFSYSNGNRAVFYSIITFFAIIYIIAPLKFKIKTLRASETVKYYLFFSFIIILFIPIIIDFGLNINPKVLLLSDIYVARSSFKSNLSSISSYSFWWLAKISVPVFLVYSIQNKKYIHFLVGIVILIYLFLISGHKSVYFTPILILFFYYMGKTYDKKLMFAMTGLLIFIILLNIPDLLINRNLFKSIFVRRIFFVPALLNEYYFDFFTNNHIYLSHSILSHFFDYQFTADPAYVIGETYFNKPDMSSNNGLISDAYMNFGYAGVVIYSLIFATILAFFNSIEINHKYFGIFVFYMMIFRGSAFLTVILTHGFWIMILLSFLIFKEKNKKIS